VAATLASLMLLLGYGNWGAPGPWLLAGLALGAAAAWRAWRIVGPGPRAVDWAAIAFAALGTLLMVAYAATEVA
jgi:hypothetical protein